MTDCTTGSIHTQDAWHTLFNLVCWMWTRGIAWDCSPGDKHWILTLTEWKEPKCVRFLRNVKSHGVLHASRTFPNTFWRHSSWLECAAFCHAAKSTKWHSLCVFREERGNRQNVFYSLCSEQDMFFTNQSVFFHTGINKTFLLFIYFCCINIKDALRYGWLMHKLAHALKLMCLQHIDVHHHKKWIPILWEQCWHRFLAWLWAMSSFLTNIPDDTGSCVYLSSGCSPVSWEDICRRWLLIKTVDWPPQKHNGAAD